MSRVAALTIAIGFIFVALLGQCSSDASLLQVGFYKGKCGEADVEAVVESVVTKWFLKDPTITPALLRLYFHDCFVTARGGRYNVETGRRDGFVSRANLVNLPDISISVPDSIKAFAQKGLNVSDMVYLLGAHTVGVAHCANFKDRLYNYQNTGRPDRTMSPLLLLFLRAQCPPDVTIEHTAHLAQTPLSSLIVDRSYYLQIKMNRGVLHIDQELALDPSTKDIVAGIAISGFDFSYQFGQALIKLGSVEVLTGDQGEIRTSCRAVNRKDVN